MQLLLGKDSASKSNWSAPSQMKILSRFPSESSSGVPAHLEHNLTDVEKVEHTCNMRKITWGLLMLKQWWHKDMDSQIYAIYDWLAYNENKESAPVQEQGDEIFLINAWKSAPFLQLCHPFRKWNFLKGILCVCCSILWNMKWARWSLATGRWREPFSTLVLKYF